MASTGPVLSANAFAVMDVELVIGREWPYNLFHSQSQVYRLRHELVILGIKSKKISNDQELTDTIRSHILPSKPKGK